MGEYLARGEGLDTKLLVKNAKQRLSASDVLSHPWFNNNYTNELTTPAKLRRNNSTHELSLFAESASAVNRVVLQHMSRDTWVEDTMQGNILGLSPPQESNDAEKEELVTKTHKELFLH